MPIRTTITALAMMLLALALFVSEQPTSYAQTNLLQNGGFEGPGSYVDQRPAGVEESFAIAGGWNGWQTDTPSTEPWMNIPPIAFPHTGSFVQDGTSQNIGRGNGTFTAAVYQTIGGVAEGTTFRFSSWVFQDNSAGNGAQTRIGIGSNVGGDPFGTPITWSPWLTAIDSWQQISVEATVPAGSVTVFIYSTQRLPDNANQNYYDDAELINVGEGGDVNVGDGSEGGGEGDEAAPPAPPTSTPQTFAPFVSAQGGDDSGRIVHTVQSGDTLAAIAVAYGVSSSEILELNGLTSEQARFLRVGQELIISEGDPDAAASGEDDTETDTSEESADSDSGSGGGFASPTPAEVAAATEEPTPIPSPTPVPEDTEDADDEEDADVELTKAEPTFTPEPTEIPATATDAPSAPVDQGEDSDPLDIETGVCALMFEDANSNTIRDGEEGLLADGVIVLSDSTGAVIEEYTTDGESEPHCFEELAPGNYQMRATAPTGFGLASSSRAVNIQAGQAFTVSFGAIAGLEVAEVPTLVPDTDADADTEIIEEDADASNNFRNLAGILVLGLAGVVLVGGIAVGVVVGRS
ncbi:MAG: LysM peptidoglycan-binding domain-containing protein [Chloroflexota bacterium]